MLQFYPIFNLLVDCHLIFTPDSDPRNAGRAGGTRPARLAAAPSGAEARPWRWKAAGEHRNVASDRSASDRSALCSIQLAKIPTKFAENRRNLAELKQVRSRLDRRKRLQVNTH